MREIKTSIAVAVCLVIGTVSCFAQEPTWNINKVNPADAEFVGAKINAQRKWPVFTENFAKTKEGFVKIALKDPKNVEHVWLEVEAIKGDKIEGSIGNQLEVVKGYSVGQKVTVNKADVEDWFFTDGKKKIGGWTIEIYLKRNPTLRDKCPAYVQPK